MNEERKVDLDAVLDDFLSSPSAGEPLHLREWIQRYPEFHRELTQLALTRKRMQLLPAEEPNPDEDDAYEALGLDIVRQVLDRQRSKAPRPVPITNLLSEASTRGLNARGLARTLRLSVPLVNRLQRRLIAFSSIPRQLIEELASILEREAEAVAAYLQQQPTFASGVNYKSETAPVLGEAEDFFQAIRTDLGITDADRAHWLSCERTNNGDSRS